MLIDNVNEMDARITSDFRLCGAVGDAAAEDYGYRWEIQIVEFGADKQRLIFWDSDALRAAMPLYEGAKVFALSEAQHQAAPHTYGKSVRDLVGWMDGVAENATGLKGYFNILRSARWLRDTVVDSWARGKKDLIGVSHDVGCTATTKAVDGKTMKSPLKIHDVTIDVVYDPAAGGKFLRMAAAGIAGQQTEEKMKERLLAAFKTARPKDYAAFEAKVVSMTDEETLTAFTAAMAVQVLVCSDCGEKVAPDDTFCPSCGCRLIAEGGGPAMYAAVKNAEKLLKRSKLVACGLTFDRMVAASGLPELSQERLRQQFADKEFEPESLKAAITSEKEYVDKLTGAGVVTGAGGIRPGEDAFDKRAKMLDDFFEGKVRSLKAAYINFTGDTDVTGRLSASATRMRASVDSTTFALALGDSMTRRMVAEYNAAPMSDWRKIASVVPLVDFRTNRRDRVGGYGDIPAVAQGAPYAALTSPTNEEATYSATKRGGTEDVTIEAIKNDDVGAVRRIPQKLARAAARTLYKFVFDFLAANPTIYDSTALFTTGHGNLATGALTATTLAARRQAMLKKTELNSGQVLGIPPKYAIVPVDLDKTMYDLVAAPRNSDFNPTGADYTRTLQMEMIVVPYWTDTNDWYLAAALADIPGIEVGFLDGKEEPELFVQDLPNVGSMFSNDKLTYKLRHIYGGSVLDFRAFDGSRVP